MNIEIAHHPGASFCEGSNRVHVWVEDVDAAALVRAWGRYLVTWEIAKPLAVSEASGRLHASGECYPFLPARIVQRIVEQCAAPEADDSALLSELTEYRYDSGMIAMTYGLHREAALRRGWPAWPLVLGRMASLIVGAGNRHALASMNLAPAATALVGVGSQDKSVGRDLLSTYGLPTAPGGLATTPEIAVFHGQRVGWPVVLKRLSGGNSDGVILNIRTAEECREAAGELLRGTGAILVEKAIRGIELRVHFVAGLIEQVLLRVPNNPVGDGTSTLGQILAQARSGYIETYARSHYFRRQTVYRLWELGVREFEDLDRLVPRAGQAVPLGKDFHRLRDEATEARALHPADRRRIEEFLAGCGNPSGALDLIVSKIGKPLNEGGAVLEINVPSGMWYLDRKEHAVERELDAWTAHRPGFHRSKGRIPFWIAAGDTDAESEFRTRYPRGRTMRLRDEGGWAPILTARVDQILVRVDDDEIRRQGLPMNLAPTIAVDEPEAFPYLTATLKNAGPGVKFHRSTKIHYPHSRLEASPGERFDSDL